MAKKIFSCLHGYRDQLRAFWYSDAKKEIDPGINISIIQSESIYPVPEHLDISEINTQDTFVLESDRPLVIIETSAFESAVRHGWENPACEVGGILLGKVFKDKNRPRFLIRIQQSITCDPADGYSFDQRSSSLTFRTEAWRCMVAIYSRDYADLRILGWYHTHPGFGVRLSSMDLFIHDNFFNTDWHVAIVIDPLNNLAGFFFRKEANLLPPKVICWTGNNFSNLTDVTSSKNDSHINRTETADNEKLVRSSSRPDEQPKKCEKS
jgi:proteasome lid subunit RPN8/RPN11